MFGKDVATSAFSRTSGSTYNIHERTDSAFKMAGNNMSVNMDDGVEKFSLYKLPADSSKSKGSQKRGQANDDLMITLRESLENLRTALVEATETTANLTRNVTLDVVMELVKITNLTLADISLTHQWLSLHQDMALIFLSTPIKSVIG